jgi:hypothetical protein
LCRLQEGQQFRSRPTTTGGCRLPLPE